MSDLDILAPAETTLTVGGENLVISPLRVGQLPAFLRAIGPVAQQLGRGEIDWLAMLADHGDNVLQAIAVAVRRPRDWVDALATDEALLLAAKVIEVNADFFTRSVLPHLATNLATTLSTNLPTNLPTSLGSLAPEVVSDSNPNTPTPGSTRSST
jgi:hypothetical protein